MAEKKPKEIKIEPITAWPKREPTAKNPNWWWRAVAHEGGERWDVWTGRGSRADVKAILVKLVQTGEYRQQRPARAEQEDVPRVLWQLVDKWILSEEARASLAKKTKTHRRASGESLIYRKTGRKNRKNWLSRTFGSQPLERLRTEHIQAYVDERLAEGAAPRTIRAELENLGMAWRWGRSMGYCPDRDITLPPVEGALVREKRIPTPGEVATVLRHLEGWTRLCCLLLHATGARIGEIATLTWERVIEHSDGAVELRLIGKNRRKYGDGWRRVWLLPDNAAPLIAALKAQREEHKANPRMNPKKPDELIPYVLGVAAETSASDFGTQLRKACKSAKITPWTPGGHRRAASVQLLESRVDPLTYRSHMDHSWEMGLANYARATAEHERRAASHLGRLPAGEVVDLETARRDRDERAQSHAHT